MDRHGLEAEVMSTFASQVLRSMILSYCMDCMIDVLLLGKNSLRGIEVFMLETCSYAELTNRLEGVSHPRIS